MSAHQPQFMCHSPQKPQVEGGFQGIDGESKGTQSKIIKSQRKGGIGKARTVGGMGQTQGCTQRMRSALRVSADGARQYEKSQRLWYDQDRTTSFHIRVPCPLSPALIASSSSISSSSPLSQYHHQICASVRLSRAAISPSAAPMLAR